MFNKILVFIFILYVISGCEENAQQSYENKQSNKSTETKLVGDSLNSNQNTAIEFAIENYDKAAIINYLDKEPVDGDEHLEDILQLIYSKDDAELFMYFLPGGINYINGLHRYSEGFFLYSLRHEKHNLYNLMMDKFISNELKLSQEDISEYLYYSLSGKLKTKKIDIIYFNKILSFLKDINELKGPYNKSFLILAIENKHKDVANLLLENGIDVTLKDSGLVTALMLASGSGYVDIYKRLLEMGADFSAKDGANYATPTADDIALYGKTALDYAILNGRLNILKLYPQDKYYDNSALNSAVRKRDIELIRFFLNKKTIDINKISDNGLTALGNAVMTYHHEYRYKKSFNPDYVIEDNGEYPIINILLENGAKINIKNSYGETTMDYVAYLGYQKLIDYMISKGGIINKEIAQSALNSTAFFQYASMDVVKFLFKYKPDVNHKNSEGITMLNRAIETNSVEAIKYLLEKKVNFKNNSSYLEQAFMGDSYETASVIIEYATHNGGDVNAVNSNNMPVIFNLVNNNRWNNKDKQTGKSELYQLFKKLERNIHYGVVNDKGETLLKALISSNKDYATAKFLIDNNVDINKRDKNLDTPLTSLLKSWTIDVRLFNLLLDNGADVNLADKKGDTPLHLVLKNYRRMPYIEFIQFLIKAGADTSIKNKNNETVFDVGSTTGANFISYYNKLLSGKNIDAYSDMQRKFITSDNCIILTMPTKTKTNFSCKSPTVNIKVDLMKDYHEQGEFFIIFNINSKLDIPVMLNNGKILNSIVYAHNAGATKRLREWLFIKLKHLENINPLALYADDKTSIEVRKSKRKGDFNLEIKLFIKY